MRRDKIGLSYDSTMLHAKGAAFLAYGVMLIVLARLVTPFESFQESQGVIWVLIGQNAYLMCALCYMGSFIVLCLHPTAKR